MTINGLVTTFSSAAQGITGATWFTNLISTIIAFIQVAVIGLATIRFTLVGIKYFTANAASAKADCKGELVRTFIGGVIAFLALQITRIIFEIFNP